jgi:hypothetical protein
MFHPFQQTNHLQTLDTTYATKYLPRTHNLEDMVTKITTAINRAARYGSRKEVAEISTS